MKKIKKCSLSAFKENFFTFLKSLIDQTLADNRELKILEKANHKPLVELARLALLLIDHATDHEWWNAILRSMKAKHTPIEAVHA